MFVLIGCVIFVSKIVLIDNRDQLNIFSFKWADGWINLFCPADFRCFSNQFPSKNDKT